MILTTTTPTMILDLSQEILKLKNVLIKVHFIFGIKLQLLFSFHTTTKQPLVHILNASQKYFCGFSDLRGVKD
uniref:Ovule protein n=1 Tax=Romanomermis culicivorax TaxID=13658 RepID=A0A915IF16_ROMCU